MRTLFFSFGFGLALLAQAQTPVNVRVGNLACAAVRRPPAQVQTYCYAYPPSPTWVLLHNQIDTVPPVRTMTVYGKCDKVDPGNPWKCLDPGADIPALAWRFTLRPDGSIQYEYCADGLTIVTGTLP